MMKKRIAGIILPLLLLVTVFPFITQNAAAAPAPAPYESAAPTSSSVLVNDMPVAFQAYNINDNNYFKLRDLAYVLNGTAKQFAVGYDDATKAITLTSGQPYTAVGGELTGSGGTSAVYALPSESAVYLDGIKIKLKAYNINGNNYFKLRDVG